MNIFQKLFQRKAQPRRARLQLFPDWYEQTARWALTGGEAYIAEGYNLNAVIFSAINYKARAAAGVPLRAYGGSREQPEALPPDHPLSRFCDRPNAFMSFSEMQMTLEVYYNLFGNAYVLFDRRADEIKAYALRPDRVTHAYKNGELVGYAYHPYGTGLADATPLLASDVLHVKIPNPGDPWAGMGPGLSPLAPMARSADVDNAATAFLKIFFDRGAMPLGLITTEQQIDDNTSQMLKDRWIATYGGSKNWIEPLVFGAGATYTRIGANFDEMDLVGIDRRNTNRMVMPFGVPLILLDASPGVTQPTYDNARLARQMFWEDTMLPELRGFEVEWAYYLRNDAGESVYFDYGDIPALMQARLERANIIGQAFDRSAATRDEYRAALGFAPLPGGDVVKISMGVQLIPATQAIPAPTEAGAAASEDEETAAKSFFLAQVKVLSNERKAEIYRQFDQKAVDFEERFSNEAAAQFENDRRNIMAIINGAQKAAYADKATVNLQEMLLKIEDYLTMSGENWRQAFIPLFAAQMMAHDQDLAQEFGMEFDVRNLAGEQWFQDYALKFAQEITATSAEQIKGVLAPALAEGWSVPKIEEQLNMLFEEWVKGGGVDAGFAGERLPQYRRELIARTETVRASNAGAFHLYEDWGVPSKEWYATADARTRDAHRVGAAFGQPPLTAATNERFYVGGEYLAYPGDPSGSPENTINCRCTVLPVMPE